MEGWRTSYSYEVKIENSLLFIIPKIDGNYIEGKVIIEKNLAKALTAKECMNNGIKGENYYNSMAHVGLQQILTIVTPNLSAPDFITITPEDIEVPELSSPRRIDVIKIGTNSTKQSSHSLHFREELHNLSPVQMFRREAKPFSNVSPSDPGLTPLNRIDSSDNYPVQQELEKIIEKIRQSRKISFLYHPDMVSIFEEDKGHILQISSKKGFYNVYVFPDLCNTDFETIVKTFPEATRLEDSIRIKIEKEDDVIRFSAFLKIE